MAPWLGAETCSPSGQVSPKKISGLLWSVWHSGNPV